MALLWPFANPSSTTFKVMAPYVGLLFLNVVSQCNDQDGNHLFCICLRMGIVTPHVIFFALPIQKVKNIPLWEK